MKHLRTIKSFVKREGRLTQAQKRALTSLYPTFGLSSDQGLIDWQHCFKRTAPLTLEIGFGMGHSLLENAKQHPATNFIGIEVYRAGVGSLLTQIEQHELANIRIFNEDAVNVLQNCFTENSIDTVQLFFPDPWPKKRHHKRRLVQSSFLDLLAPKLKTNGVFHIATDWQDYAEHCMAILNNDPRFINSVGTNCYTPRPATRPLTKYEKRGLKLNHDVWDLCFQKK